MISDEFDTDREVSGINYKMIHCYGSDKVMAKIEAYYQRLSGKKYARPMKVLGGDFEGEWACYVSYINKGA